MFNYLDMEVSKGIAFTWFTIVWTYVQLAFQINGFNIDRPRQVYSSLSQSSYHLVRLVRVLADKARKFTIHALDVPLITLTFYRPETRVWDRPQGVWLAPWYVFSLVQPHALALIFFPGCDTKSSPR
jgi:hypothetical protein